MKVVLLATGETAKLRPLTDALPEPLVPLAGRPVMSYAIELLARQGIKDIIVCVHRLAGNIERHFGSGKRWGVRLEYVLLSTPVGSAGALLRTRSFLTETFLVLPADILLAFDSHLLFTEHRVAGNIATVVLAKKSESAKQFEATGAYLLEPDVLDLTAPRRNADIALELVPAIENSGKRVGQFHASGYWNPLATFQDHHQAQSFLVQGVPVGLQPESLSVNGSGTAPTYRLGGRQIADHVWIGRNNQIHPSARFSPPVYIGEGNRIGRGVDLGPGTFIGTNNVIDEEATVSRSTILDNTYVGQLVQLDGRLVQESLVVDIDSTAYVRVTDTFLVGRISHHFGDTALVRLLEMSLLLIALPLLLPVMLICALSLLLTQGRVLEGHETAGVSVDHLGTRRQQTFRRWRFATRTKSGRAHRLGTVLKHLHLDRLPELANVLLGQMHLVGVKPLEPSVAASLTEQWQVGRQDYLPGFTGYWYLRTHLDSTLEEVVANDVYYVATRTWWVDLRILWETAITWLRRLLGRSH